MIVLNLVRAQYVTFFKFKTDKPKMVVSTISDMVQPDFGQRIHASINLFTLFFAGDDEAT